MASLREMPERHLAREMAAYDRAVWLASRRGTVRRAFLEIIGVYVCVANKGNERRALEISMKRKSITSSALENWAMMAALANRRARHDVASVKVVGPARRPCRPCAAYSRPWRNDEIMLERRYRLSTLNLSRAYINKQNRDVKCK